MTKIIYNHIVIYNLFTGLAKSGLTKNGNVVFCGLQHTIYVYRKLMKDQTKQLTPFT